MNGYRSWSMVECQSPLPNSTILPHTITHSQSMVGLSRNQSPQAPKNGCFEPYRLAFDPLVKSASQTPRRRRHKITLGNTPDENSGNEKTLFSSPRSRPSTLPRASKSPLKLTSASATPGDAWEMGPQKPFKIPATHTANPVPHASKPNTCETSPGGSKVLGSYPEPNFSPANHHPDLLSSLPSDSNETSRRDCVTSTVQGDPSGDGSLVETDRIVPLENMPITPPLSPRVDTHPPPAENASSDQEYYSMEAEPFNYDEPEPWAMACQDYTSQSGVFWDKACLLLEEHFLHPSNLSQREFVSLVCAREENTTNWFHHNLAHIVHRTVGRWTEANTMLIEAGISPCKLRDQFLNEFEYMDCAERMEFIRNYEMIESRVSAAENTLYFTDEQRRAFVQMSIMEQYDYITNCATLHDYQATRSPLKRSDLAIKRDSFKSKVDYLKAEKAGKFKSLQSKLDEMKLIEKTINEPDGPLSQKLDSCLVSISKDHNQKHVDLPSYSDVESYIEESEQHDCNGSGCSKLVIVRTAPVYCENKPQQESWEKILPDDPFVEHSPSHEPSTKGNLCHQYGSIVQSSHGECQKTPVNGICDMPSPSSLNVPYYDGVEYQDYVDDTWRCYEESAIPVTHGIKATSPYRTDAKDFAVVTVVTELTNTKVLDTDLSGDHALTSTASADSTQTHEQVRQFAAEMLAIANTVETTADVQKPYEQFQTGVDATHRDSAVCMEMDHPDQQPANNNGVGGMVVSPDNDKKPTIRKASMSTILSQSSVTSEKVMLRSVSTKKPDMKQEAFTASVHLEFMETRPKASSLDDEIGAGKDSSEAGKEDVASGDMARKKSVRKKLSRFFGSLRSRSSRSKDKSADDV